MLTPYELRVRSIVQAAVDGLGTPIDRARVLDLGAAGGDFAAEFARLGAGVVAIEARASGVARARLTKEALRLDRLEIVQADVRELTLDAYGQFDVVLCLGILYHLDGPSAIRLVHLIAEVARRLAVVDTHVSLKPNRSIAIDGRTYWGRRVREFDPGATREEQEQLRRSAIGNPESLWLTRSSLMNLLSDVGFTSVAEVHVPRYQKRADRVTLLAFKGSRALVEPGRWPERERSRPRAEQTWRGTARLALAPYVPRRFREYLRRRRKRVGRRRGWR